MKLIDILIPTYNRADDLLANLAHLKEEIVKHNLQDEVRIIISDNCSPDQTQEKLKSFVSTYSAIEVIFFRNEINIGLEANVVNVFKKAQSRHVLFCGDDDLIASGYIKFCVDSVKKNPELGVIIPGLKWVDKKDNEIIGRIESFDVKLINPGYDATFVYSHFAHQMSGLVIRNGEILEKYLSMHEFRNPYLFIFFTAYCLMQFESIYAPKFKTAVQVENEKDWGYNQVGLLNEVFKSYYALNERVDKFKQADLLIQFVRMHSYRLNIKWSEPISLLRKWFYLIRNTDLSGGFGLKLTWLLFKEYMISFK